MKKIFVTAVLLFAPIVAYSAQQTWSNGDALSAVRTKILANDSDLYNQAATHWVSDGHTYTADIDTVTHGGKIYICTTTHNSSDAGVAGNEPGVGGNWQDVWDVSGNGVFEPAQTAASQAEVEAGTESALRSFSPLRIKQAIDALGGSESSTLGALTDITGEGTTDYMLYDDGDGTFSFRAAPSGTMTWPSTAGIVGWTSGTTWDHYTLDTDLSSVSASDDSIPSAKAVDATYQKISGMEYVDVDGTTIEKASGDGSESTPWLLGVKSGVYQTILTNPVVQANLGTGVYTFLGTPSITNFFTALTGEGAFADDLLGYADASAVRAGLDLEPGIDFYSTTAVNSAITAAEFQSLAVSDLSDSTSPHVLTTAETTSKIISSYSAGSTDKSFEFGSAHAKLNVIFGIGDAYQLDLIPPSGTAFYLNGTEMASDEHIVNSADTVGEQIVCFSMVISGSQRIMCESKYTDFAEATP